MTLALTLWQPWAWAIGAASLGDRAKRVENRTWAPPRGVVGGPPLALHAGQAVDADALEALAAHGLRPPAGAELVRGAVVAVARVVAVVAPPRGDRDEAARACAVGRPYYRIVDASAPPERVHELLGRAGGLWYSGAVGWVLDDVVELARPVPYAGAQRVWALPGPVAAEVAAEVAFALRTGRGGRP